MTSKEEQFERLDKYNCDQLTRMLCTEMFSLKMNNLTWVKKNGGNVFDAITFEPTRSINDLYEAFSIFMPKKWAVTFFFQKGPLSSVVGVRCPEYNINLGGGGEGFTYFKCKSNPQDAARAMVRAILCFKEEFKDEATF